MIKSIYIATHVPFIPPKSNLYKPIEVGSAIHNVLPYLKDNTGDNISNKNPFYCELTALYWMWKNSNEDVVGLAHYRRYFTSLLYSPFATLSLNKMNQKSYIIVPKPQDFKTYTVKEQYSICHHEQDYIKCEETVKELYPQYAKNFDIISNQTKLYCYNMFVMPKNLFDEYCNWLFPILETLEKNINYQQYDDYNKRVFGFLAERLFTIWIHHQQTIEKKELDVTTIQPLQKQLQFSSNHHLFFHTKNT